MGINNTFSKKKTVHWMDRRKYVKLEVKFAKTHMDTRLLKRKANYSTIFKV